MLDAVVDIFSLFFRIFSNIFVSRQSLDIFSFAQIDSPYFACPLSRADRCANEKLRHSNISRSDTVCIRQTTSRRNSSREFPATCFRLAGSNLYRGINAVSFDHSLHSLSIFPSPNIPSRLFGLSIRPVELHFRDRARKLAQICTINANIKLYSSNKPGRKLQKSPLMILIPVE